jgi:hypothetical protein
MNDDVSITQFAAKYRHTAAAVLVQIAMDEAQPAAARAACAEKILAYSDGRPGASKAITVADLELMSDEQRRDLLNALLTRYEVEMPGQFKALMEEAYVSAMKRMSLPNPNRFRRGPPAAPLGPQVPLPRGTQSTASSLMTGGGSIPSSPEHNTSMYTPLNDAYGGGDVREVPERSGTEPPPDTNVIPLPYGLKYGLADSIAPTQSNTPPIPSNGVDPQVLARSARPPGMAMDLAFQGYSPRSRW